jgi:hypothetical protein
MARDAKDVGKMKHIAAAELKSTRRHSARVRLIRARLGAELQYFIGRWTCLSGSFLSTRSSCRIELPGKGDKAARCATAVVGVSRQLF